MKRSVLITGGAGNFGRSLVKRFGDAGWTVRVFELPTADVSHLQDDVEVIRGDLTDERSEPLSLSLEGVDAVAHLAAVMPPGTERDRTMAFAVNVGATENLVAAVQRTNPAARLVFSSTIAVYGDTSAKTAPIATTYSGQPINIYGESKLAAEAVVRASSLKTVVIRIAGVAFMRPPAVWPFTPDQRVEMVHRGDVVDALFAAAEAPGASGKTFNIGGGPTWRFKGKDYVRDFYEGFGTPEQVAAYPDTPGYRDWYETEEAQRILRFQNRAYGEYLSELRHAAKSRAAG